MSKSHTIYVIVGADGRFIDACLSYSEATRIVSAHSGASIRSVYGREDY